MFVEVAVVKADNMASVMASRFSGLKIEDDLDQEREKAARKKAAEDEKAKKKTNKKKKKSKPAETADAEVRVRSCSQTRAPCHLSVFTSGFEIPW